MYEDYCDDLNDWEDEQVFQDGVIEREWDDDDDYEDDDYPAEYGSEYADYEQEDYWDQF
jgi:hypothetical protein